MQQKKLLLMINGHDEPITTIDVSPNGSHILSGSTDATVKVWERSEGYKPRIFRGHVDSVTKAKLMPRGPADFVSCSLDGTARYWQYESGRYYRTINTRDIFKSGTQIPLIGLDISQVYPHVILCPKTLISTLIWDLYHGNLFIMRGELQGEMFSSETNSFNYMAPIGGQDAAFSPNGKFAAMCTERTIFLWELSSGKIIKYFGGPPSRFFISDDQIFVQDNSDFLFKMMESSGVRHRGDITSIDFSPDNSAIASSSMDHTVRIWSLVQSITSPLATIEHVSAVNCVKFVGNGFYVVIGGEDGLIILWDLKTGKIVTVFRGHKAGITGLAIASESNLLISSGRDGMIGIWELIY